MTATQAKFPNVQKVIGHNMWEFDNLTDLEKTMARIFEDERIKKIGQDFHQLRTNCILRVTSNRKRD